MRLEQLERVIATYGALRGSARPARITDVHHEVRERMGTNYCERTTLRDLQLLERIGIAEHIDARWQILGPLSFFEASEVMLRRGAG